MANARILLIGNHTCGNRGDSAILRGLLQRIDSQHPGAHIDITSRYPTSSSYLLGRQVDPDPFHGTSLIPPSRAREAIHRTMPWLLMSGASSKLLQTICLPKPVMREIDGLSQYDLVIQVGGSFFVDLYGPHQFEAAFAALAAGCRVALVGHSIGPVGGRAYNKLLSKLLTSSDYVSLRETISLNLLRDAGMPVDRIEMGADTAWAVDPIPIPGIDLGRDYFPKSSRTLIAITVRRLAPFDRRLGIAQIAYEKAFATLVEKLIAGGNDVIALSTCTGIDSYFRDDRMVALKIGTLVANPKHYQVVMEEWNDVELGTALGQCELLIGTRLHSAIIAMNFGTTAIALNYEHKSEGILSDMGLSNLAVPIKHLLDGSLVERVQQLLESNNYWQKEIEPRVQQARRKAHATIDAALSLIT